MGEESIVDRMRSCGFLVPQMQSSDLPDSPMGSLPMLQSFAMTNLKGIIKQLEEERSRIDRAIAALRGVHSRRGSSGRPRRSVSAAARRRIAAAQRARWAKVKAGKK